MAKKNDWKHRDGVVFSTNKDFEFQYEGTQEEETLPAQQQNLRVLLDKSGRAGKQVTLVTGFTGKTGDLEQLAKTLKSKLGIGGSVKDREIILQGDWRDKAVQVLAQLGYKSKRVG
jgi:translation initiation factor 1